MRLVNKIALITGAGGHVGRATVLRLSDEGAFVVLFDNDPAKLKIVTDELTDRARVFLSFEVDVTDRRSVDTAVETVIAETERIDILVNTAGGPRNGLVADLSDDDWDYAVDLNLKGTFSCIRAVVPHMKAAGGGRIVNTSSTSKNGVPWFAHIGQSNYAAANAGLVGLTRALAFELAPHDITINSVVPGPIETPKSKEGFSRLERSPEVKVTPLDAIPLGRLARPEDVAGGIAFLVSDDASYVTGTMLNISGGLVG